MNRRSIRAQTLLYLCSLNGERQKAKEAGPTPAHKARPETHATMLAYSIDDLKINIDQIGSTLVVVVVSLFYFNIWRFRAEGFVLHAAGQCSNLRTPNRSDRPLKLVLKRKKNVISEKLVGFELLFKGIDIPVLARTGRRTVLLSAARRHRR